MSSLLKTSTFVLVMFSSAVFLAGCGSNDPEPVAAPSDEPLKLGDDSPLDQLGADPGQN